MSAGEVLDWGWLPPEQAISREMHLCISTVPESGETALAFWRSLSPAVMLGKGRKVEDDVYADKACDDGVPIIVRPSGGGTVFLPGKDDAEGGGVGGLVGGRVLCVTVVLPVPGSDLAKNPIRKLFEVGLAPLINALKSMGIDARFEGKSDVAVNGRKLAGSAQARKRRAVLVHASVLIKTPIAAIERYLKRTEDEPDYRQGRSHGDFLVDLVELTGLSADAAEAKLVERIAAVVLP